MFIEKFLLTSLDAASRSKIMKKIANAPTIEGFPVSRKVQWDARNTTCAAPPEPEQEKGSLDTGSFKGFLTSVSKQLVDQEVKQRKEQEARELELARLYAQWAIQYRGRTAFAGSKID